MRIGLQICTDLNPKEIFWMRQAGEKTGANIPHLDRPLSEIARELGEQEPAFESRLQKLRESFSKPGKTYPSAKGRQGTDRLEWIDDLRIRPYRPGIG